MKIKIKIILSYLLPFLATVLLVAIILVGSFIPYTASKEAVLKELEKQNYFESVAEETMSEMKLDIISSGLPSSILDNIFTSNDIKEEINKSLTATYNKQDYEINTQGIEENLTKNIEGYLAENNIVITDEEALKTFVEETTNTYKSGINLYGYSKYIKSVIKKIKDPIMWLMLGLIISEILLIFLIIRFAKEKYFGTIFFSSAMLLFLTNIYLTSHLDINHLFLFSNSFSSVLKALINNVLNHFLISEIILVIIAIIYVFLNGKKTHE